MEYSNGYVAFIDILGFSNLVSNEKSADQIKDLFGFIEKFQYFFNSSPTLNTDVAFFSDSIILSTDNKTRDNLEMLFCAIWIAESYLHKHTNLFFRGGITKGLYYHKDSIAFGPAVVNSYRLENQAVYSRILIEDKIVSNMEEVPFSIMKDTDGKYCFNPYSIGLLRNTPDGTNPTKEQFMKSIRQERELLLQAIKANLYTNVSEKYLWRIIPFNNVCASLPDIYNKYHFDFNESDIEEWKSLMVSMKDIEDNYKAKKQTGSDQS